MNSSSNSSFSFKSLVLPASIGALLPLGFLLFIILTKEAYFESWMYFPLIIIPIGGAIGAIFFYMMGFQWFPTGGKKLVAIIFSTILYFAAIWISSVMAFAVTGHWN